MLDEIPALGRLSFFETALTSRLAPDAADQREAATAKRLDRLSRQVECMERDQNILIETLTLYVRYYLTVSTPIPEIASLLTEVVSVNAQYFISLRRQQYREAAFEISDNLHQLVVRN